MRTHNKYLLPSEPLVMAPLWLPEGQDFIFQQFNTRYSLLSYPESKSSAMLIPVCYNPVNKA